MPTIVAVHRSPTHTFSKYSEPSIHLLTGLGVEGDAHCGPTVRHRYLARKDPAAPNLAQVHLLEAEFLETLSRVAPPSDQMTLVPEPILPGQFGENITTRGLALCTLPHGTRLRLGATALIEFTNLRSPCKLMNGLRPGLMKASFHPGTRLPRAGVLAIVLEAGTVRAEDFIEVLLPEAPHRSLQPA